jgi:cytochrome c-type biogenesis protein CcmF
MIPELGLFTLCLALITSLLQSALPLIGVARNQTALMHAGRMACFVSFILVILSFGALMTAHVTDDFSVLNVAMNSHTLKPLLYKITGTWASHEGSMMLWVLILTAFGAGLAFFAPTMPLLLRARALAVQGMMGVGFIAFILFTSNPFGRLFPSPVEGNDLNPLLQDPGLAFHPPYLYIGYVGFSSVFALAAAILLTTEHKPATLIKYLRPWALLAWSSLTFGIAMGSWWAYYELGWGGFWFWDPVENAALMPWLAGTALLHMLIASQKRAAFLRWTILLSIICFSLSLLGTFLVRSGVLTSVHSFAVDPERGIFVLALLAVAVGGALALYAARAHRLTETPAFEPVSRESFMLLNSLLLCSSCATVVTGTLYPLLLDAVGGGTVSVGAPYFNATILPLMTPVAVLMIIGPLLRWQTDQTRKILPHLMTIFGFSLSGSLVALYIYGYRPIMGLLAVMLGLWVVFGTALDGYKNRTDISNHLHRLLAHAGFGLTIIGIAGSSFSHEYQFLMHPHQVEQAGDYRLELSGIDTVMGPNYQAARGIFHITGHDFAVTMQPEQRYYPTQNMALTDVAIHTNFLRDIYLAMGEEQDSGDGTKGRTVRLHINPLVPLIWIGGAVMALGGILRVMRREKPTVQTE